jgi:hypothetical protein
MRGLGDKLKAHADRTIGIELPIAVPRTSEVEQAA